MIEHKPLFLITDGGHLRREKKLIPRILETFTHASDYLGFLLLREQVPDSSNPASDEELIRICAELRGPCKEHGVRLMINRRIDLHSYVDGVHLGIGGDMAAPLRSDIREDTLLGYSAHAVEELSRAEQAGFDYTFFSPIFPPISKSISGKPQGLEALREACSVARRPVFALGGITPENTVACMRAGASGVATIGSLLYADDISATAHSFALAFESARRDS